MYERNASEAALVSTAATESECAAFDLITCDHELKIECRTLFPTRRAAEMIGIWAPSKEIKKTLVSQFQSTPHDCSRGDRVR